MKTPDDFWAWVGMAFLCLFLAVIFIGGAIGYVLNLVAIAHWAGPIGMLILRVVGAFIAPLGAILGWIT